MRGCKLISVLLIISTTCFSQQAQTQTQEQAQTQAQAQAQTQVSNNIYANISGANYHAGVGYSHEMLFSPKWTVLGSVWLKGEFSWGKNFVVGRYTSLIVHPTFSAEPRFYYNLGSRQRKGKNTALNSGNYLSTTFSCFLPSIYGTNNDSRNFLHYGIAPHWGMRRVYSNNLFLEFHAGIVILIGNGESVWGPDLNIKFGYAF